MIRVAANLVSVGFHPFLGGVVDRYLALVHESTPRWRCCVSGIPNWKPCTRDRYLRVFWAILDIRGGAMLQNGVCECVCVCLSGGEERV